MGKDPEESQEGSPHGFLCEKASPFLQVREGSGPLEVEAGHTPSHLDVLLKWCLTQNKQEETSKDPTVGHPTVQVVWTLHNVKVRKTRGGSGGGVQNGSHSKELWPPDQRVSPEHTLEKRGNKRHWDC